MRNCKRCEGIGHFQYINEPMHPCQYCNGTGTFEDVNESDILNIILASKGKNKGKLRASMSSPFRSDGVIKNRAYYVWRMARFHAGVDTTMPVMAGMCVRNDPYVTELESLADKVAVDSFGNNIAGAYRWGRAFGLLG
jgi:hypothetical protein